MSLRALLIAAFSYVLALTMIAFAIPLSHVVTERIRGEVRGQSRTQAQLLSAVATGGVTSQGQVRAAARADLQRAVDAAARITRGRVIVVNRQGALELDSAQPGAARGTAYRSRPEIAAALRGALAQEQRTSSSLRRPILVTALPVVDARGRAVGAVRVSQDVHAISRALWRGRVAVVGLATLVFALGFVVALVLARRLAWPIVELRKAARAVADGDMTALAPERGSREQVEVARTFNEMTGRLDRTLTAQQQFVANASHQLRTPLTGVRLRIEEAAHGVNDAAAAHLEAAMQEVDRLSTTIDDLLRLSRVDERPQTSRPVELAGLLDEVAAHHADAARRGGRVIEVVSTDAGVVLADPGDLAQILDTFVENALRYGDGPIELRATGPVITVADRGPGLAPGEEDGRLLERFRRGAASRGHSGTGLGLAIADALAQRWGLRISLSSREGGGAIATLDGREGVA